VIYIYERGRGRRRVMHIQKFNSLGAGLMESHCNSTIPFNTTCNFPLGRRICKKCLRVIYKEPTP
jgi:hypothetical protein